MALSWLTGAQQRDLDADETTSVPGLHTSDDGPQTPAHVFAVRAFQQAIFGTPKAAGMNPRPRRRRDANGKTATDRSSEAGRRASLPTTTAPTAADLASASFTSPSKRPGILLTPGTGGQRRKTVSFGQHGSDSNVSQEAAARANTLPKSMPSQRISRHEGSEEMGKSRTVGATKSGDRETRTSQDTEDATFDLAAPRSTSGRYWKSEYESFSTKSTLEMRKLAKKEQLAKKYAKLKDTEAARFEQRLHSEQKRAEELEKSLQNYKQQLSDAVAEAKSAASKSQPGAAADGHSRQVDEELSRIKHRNKELELANEILRTEMERLKLTMTSSSKRKDDEISRLRKELADLRNKSSQRHEAAGKEEREVVGSDIWADVGFSLLDESHTPTGTPARHRPPLKPIEENSARPVPAGDALKQSTMSDERREAARKRLEERRRQRERNTVF